MKEIGGYFQVELDHYNHYHSKGIYVNSGRNALRYIVRSLQIRKIYIPAFTCASVYNALLKEDCEIIKYNIGEDFYPIDNIKTHEYIVYNNYFGLTGLKVIEMSKIYPNIIVDNSQSFFSPPTGRATIYSPRKFFGIPDGGIVIGKDMPELKLSQGTSYSVCSQLLKRIDLGAEKAYSDFIKNSNRISKYPLKRMSNLTYAILGNVDFEKVKDKRIKNYNFIKSKLKSQFPFSQHSEDVPMIYPLMIENATEVREYLIKQKIFSALYWPEILKSPEVNKYELSLTKNIVTIPIDQRYGISEMNYILEKLNGLNSL